MGDLNINLDPDNTDSDPTMIELKDKLLDVFPLAGLKQTVSKCTRQVHSQKPSLIDHSWISSMNKFVCTINIDVT